MGRIKVNKQPYSALSATSLKDFLDDRMFEFNLFHKIAHERFYRPRHKPGEKVDTSTSNIYSPIKDKVVEKGKNLDRLLDAEQLGPLAGLGRSAIETVDDREAGS